MVHVSFRLYKTDLRRSFNELEYFYLINGWATSEASQAPDFDKPAQECNDLFGYDAWSFSKVLVFISLKRQTIFRIWLNIQIFNTKKEIFVSELMLLQIKAV